MCSLKHLTVPSLSFFYVLRVSSTLLEFILQLLLPLYTSTYFNSNYFIIPFLPMAYGFDTSFTYLYASTYLRLYASTSLRLHASTTLRIYAATYLRIYASTSLRLHASTPPLRLYAFTSLRLYALYASTPLRQVYIEDITCPRVDMNFIFE